MRQNTDKAVDLNQRNIIVLENAKP